MQGRRMRRLPRGDETQREQLLVKYSILFAIRSAKYRCVAGRVIMQINRTTTVPPRKSQYLSQKMPASAPKLLRSTIVLKFG
jgi:hypothetical protein